MKKYWKYALVFGIIKKAMFLVFLFLISSCSKDDGENNENETFLQKYNDTNWVNDEEEFIFLYDEEYFMKWAIIYEGESSCYQYKEGRNISPPETGDSDMEIEIQENSSQILRIRVDYLEDESYSVAELTSDDGETLRRSIIYENDSIAVDDFRKTLTTFSRLCN